MDFGVEAEWHYFATSHGKSPRDGIGGTLKRLAAQASLQKIYSGQILTATDLYDRAANNLSEISVASVPSKEYEKEKTFLAQHFRAESALKSTQNINCIIPQSAGTINAKQYSHSETIMECEILGSEEFSEEAKRYTAKK